MFDIRDEQMIQDFCTLSLIISITRGRFNCKLKQSMTQYFLCRLRRISFRISIGISNIHSQFIYIYIYILTYKILATSIDPKSLCPIVDQASEFSPANPESKYNEPLLFHRTDTL